MIRIFAIYARVRLVKKPDWLDGFCKKYGQPYDYHITLVQSRFIDEDKIPALKEIVNEFLAGIIVPNHKIELNFSDPIFDADGAEKGEACVMINTEKNDQLLELQKNIVRLMVDYSDYYKPELEGYENNFQSHITVAMDLNKAQFEQAKKDFKDDFQCVGVIEEVVLSIVKEITPDEANNPKNLSVYKL